MIILVCGLPGSGKTYFARLLANELNAVHLSSDAVRNEMNMRSHYDEASKESVYDAILMKMDQVRSGKNLIIDATFSKKREREKYRAAAKKAGQPLKIIEVRAREDIIKERLSKPRPDSQADFDVYLKMKAKFEPVEKEHLILYSDSATLKKMIAQALAYITKAHE